MKAVVDKPHEPVALPLLSKSLASSLAAHYGVESGNRRVPAVTQSFVENELLAEAAEGFEIVLRTHAKARIGERVKNGDFAVEHFTVAGTRHWRETTQFDPPFGHAALGLTAAGLMFMNPLVRGIIIKQGFTMFSLFLMGLPTTMPVWLAEAMATCNEYVPGSVPVIIMWVATVATVVVAILLFKVKKLVDAVIHYRTEARLQREAEMQDRAKRYAGGYLDAAFTDAPRVAVDATREPEPDPAEVKIVFGDDDDEPALGPPPPLVPCPPPGGRDEHPAPPGVVIKFEDDGDAQSDASPQPPRADHFEHLVEALADVRPDALRKADAESRPDAAGRPDALREADAAARREADCYEAYRKASLEVEAAAAAVDESDVLHERDLPVEPMPSVFGRMHLTGALLYALADPRAEEAAAPAAAQKPNRFRTKLINSLKGNIAKGVGELRKMFVPQ